MNLNELKIKLVAAARKCPPSDHVPYAFEKRIMARLGGLAPADLWTLWGKALWRAAASCILLTVLLGAWSLVSLNGDSDLSEDFEGTVFADMSQQIGDGW